MRISKPILLAQLACASLLSSNHHVLAVVDGKPVTAQSGPDVKLELERSVRLAQREEDGSFTTFCSGVLLDNLTLVTSAQCIFPDRYEASDAGQIFAEVSTDTSKKVWSPITVEAFELGPRMDLLTAHLVYPTPVKGNLTLADTACDEGSDYSVVGFGLNEKNATEPVPNMSTYTYLAPSGEFSSRLRPKQGRVCAGDSGAPIYCRVHGKLALAGVVSEPAASLSAPEKDSAVESCRADELLHATTVRALDQLNKPIPNKAPHEIKPPPQ